MSCVQSRSEDFQIFGMCVRFNLVGENSEVIVFPLVGNNFRGNNFGCFLSCARLVIGNTSDCRHGYEVSLFVSCVRLLSEILFFVTFF